MPCFETPCFGRKSNRIYRFDSAGFEIPELPVGVEGVCFIMPLSSLSKLVRALEEEAELECAFLKVTAVMNRGGDFEASPTPTMAIEEAELG